MGGGSVDPVLRTLGSRGRYQLLQVLVINLGVLGAAFQLLDNVFIGRKVTWHRCATPDASSVLTAELQAVEWWNPDQVTYGQCQITVSVGNRVDTYPCLFGYNYSVPRNFSFRTEFDLVCEHALLADTLQTLVILGQGCGAVLASFVSDRYGRKRVLVWSQIGLLTVGMSIGLASSYTALALLKFLVGCLQQGVVTGKATMSPELFPAEERSLTTLVMAFMWMMGSCNMALLAYLLQNEGWRSLQCLLSAVSLVAFFQMWYLDESLRWLVANGRREAAVKVLERAARVNRKDLSPVLATLDCSTDGDNEFPARPDISVRKRNRTPDEELMEGECRAEDGMPLLTLSAELSAGTARTQTHVVRKLSVIDIFRHKRLYFISFIIWVAWFTCAFSTFTLYMMSTSLQGNPFLNFFLTAMMELPASLLFYFIVDRAGRKPTIQLFFCLAGLGLLSNGLLRVHKDNAVLGGLSVLSALLGMMGSTGIFGGMFFYTPELYPTNIRQQALGVASFAGRFGGMIAPFMVPLSEVIVWLPGAITGTFCFLVVFLFRFLPETQGRELPQTLEDIEMWEDSEKKIRRPTAVRGWKAYIKELYAFAKERISHGE